MATAASRLEFRGDGKPVPSLCGDGAKHGNRGEASADGRHENAGFGVEWLVAGGRQPVVGAAALATGWRNAIYAFCWPGAGAAALCRCERRVGEVLRRLVRRIAQRPAQHAVPTLLPETTVNRPKARVAPRRHALRRAGVWNPQLGFRNLPRQRRPCLPRGLLVAPDAVAGEVGVEPHHRSAAALD